MSHIEDPNHFDDQIKNRLEDAAFTPPEDLWSKIDERLPVVLPFYLRYRYPIAAFITAFTLISSYFIYTKYDYAYRSENFITESNTEIGKNKINTTSNHHVVFNTPENSEKSSQHTSGRSNLIAQEHQQSNTSQSVRTAVVHFEKNEKVQNRNTQSTSSNSVNLSDFNKKDKKQSFKNKKRASSTASNKTTDPTTRVLSKELSSENKNIDIASQEAFERPMTSEEIALLASLPTEPFQDDEDDLDFDSKKKQRKKKKYNHQHRGVNISPIVGAHYTAMTKSSRQGVNTSNMEQTPSFGISYGINIGYAINHRWSVNAEWIYNSVEGQKFSEKYHGITQDKYISLDYMKFPIYVKYRHQFLNSELKTPITLNFIGGAHYSQLKNMNTYIDGEIEHFEVNYNKHQWGLLSGVEIDIHPTNKIYFTLGARMSFNADAEQFPRLRGSDFVSPFSVQSGVYAKINYVFNRKVEKK